MQVSELSLKLAQIVRERGGGGVGALVNLGLGISRLLLLVHICLDPTSVM